MNVITAVLLTLVMLLPSTAGDAVQEGPREDVADGVSRLLYRLNVDGEEKRSFVMATYREEMDTKLDGKTPPVTKVIETLVYCPTGTHSEMVSLTQTWPPVDQRGGRSHGPCVLAGLGRFLEIPDMEFSAEAHSGVSMKLEGVSVTTSAHAWFLFEDNDEKPTKRLEVKFSLRAVSLKKAMQVLMDRGMAMPEQRHRSWSITLPPKPEAVAPKPDGGKKSEK